MAILLLESLPLQFGRSWLDFVVEKLNKFRFAVRRWKLDIVEAQDTKQLGYSESTWIEVRVEVFTEADYLCGHHSRHCELKETCNLRVRTRGSVEVGHSHM